MAPYLLSEPGEPGKSCKTALSVSSVSCKSLDHNCLRELCHPVDMRFLMYIPNTCNSWKGMPCCNFCGDTEVSELEVRMEIIANTYLKMCSSDKNWSAAELLYSSTASLLLWDPPSESWSVGHKPAVPGKWRGRGERPRTSQVVQQDVGRICSAVLHRVLCIPFSSLVTLKWKNREK